MLVGVLPHRNMQRMRAEAECLRPHAHMYKSRHVKLVTIVAYGFSVAESRKKQKLRCWVNPTAELVFREPAAATN